MISITKYLFEQDNVPVPQAVMDARANSLAALRAKLAARGATSLAPTAVQNNMGDTHSAVDVGTWGKLASKTVQAVTN